MTVWLEIIAFRPLSLAGTTPWLWTRLFAALSFNYASSFTHTASTHSLSLSLFSLRSYYYFSVRDLALTSFFSFLPFPQVSTSRRVVADSGNSIVRLDIPVRNDRWSLLCIRLVQTKKEPRSWTTCFLFWVKLCKQRRVEWKLKIEIRMFFILY